MQLYASSEEKAQRFNTFVANLEMIATWNKAHVGGVQLGPNRYLDWPHEVFLQKMMPARFNASSLPPNGRSLPEPQAKVPSVDLEKISLPPPTLSLASLPSRHLI